MRVFHLPPTWTVVLDILAWLVIHLGVSYLVTQVPSRLFRPSSWLYRARSWEKNGLFYEVIFLVRKWKSFLPDGAALFQGGFRKGRLKLRTRDYLQQFKRETCRCELAHWLTMLFAPTFLLWNRWYAGIIMIAYGVAANLPCIIVQRYNRLRLTAVLKRNVS